MSFERHGLRCPTGEKWAALPKAAPPQECTCRRTVDSAIPCEVALLQSFTPLGRAGESWQEPLPSAPAGHPSPCLPKLIHPSAAVLRASALPLRAVGNASEAF